MIPLVLLVLGVAAAAAMAGPSKKKASTVFRPSALHKAKPIAPIVPGSAALPTFDLYRIASAVDGGMPTPWYPRNVERLDAAVLSFNEGRSGEYELRKAAWVSLWSAAVVGLNSKDRRQGGAIDLPAHLQQARRGDFWPSHVAQPSSALELSEHWPKFLGSKHFVSQLAVALVADPSFSLFPAPRERSRYLIKMFAQAASVPWCGGSFDGWSFTEILQNSANNKGSKHKSCPQLLQGARAALLQVLKQWAAGRRALGSQLTPLLLLPFQHSGRLDKTLDASALSQLGTNADQLALVAMLADKLNPILVDKFVWWPGGPASKPSVDWGFVALILVAGLGMSVATAASAGAAGAGLAALAAAAAATGGGMYGLAKQSGEMAQESAKNGDQESKVEASALLKSALGVALQAKKVST